ncbi:MAG: hypothetical protein Ta2E_02680 [Mycoplasmoidaceae bacterium]|nr:MAG: hypothetical protein Ta2E_02680 [Mycoplasmoidaceae bacterium]
MGNTAPIENVQTLTNPIIKPKKKSFWRIFVIKNIDDSLMILSILAIVGGMLEVYTFATHNGIFCTGQNGNIVLLLLRSFNINDDLILIGRSTPWWGYLITISSFMAGVIIAVIIERIFLTSKSRTFMWRSMILTFQIGILIGCSFIPAHVAQQNWELNDVIAASLIAFSCALQMSVFKTARGMVISTTLMTANTRTFAEAFTKCIVYNDRHEKKLNFIKVIIYGQILLFFLIGVTLMALFLKFFPQGHKQYAIYACVGFLLIVQVIYTIKHEVDRKKAKARMLATSVIVR